MRSASQRRRTPGEPAPGVVLHGSGISVTLGGQRILRSVDVEVREGEWLGVIGPNGAGKSTLLRALAGLVPHSGEVTVTGGRRPRPRDIALMPQSPMLPPGMTVVEYVLLGRSAHLGWLERESPQDREIAVEALLRLDLGPFAQRLVSSLSGGEAQRVLVARALAQQSPVLMLDEPTSALDVGHQVEVLELIDELRRRDGLTVVAAMHDLGAAARYADRLMLLSEGGVVRIDQTRRVLDPVVLSETYGTPLEVHELRGHIVVVPVPRALGPTDPAPAARTDPTVTRGASRA